MVDTWLVHSLASHLGGAIEPCVVDVGYGDVPLTTLALHAALRRRFSRVHSVGVERDAARVRRAEPHAGGGVAFVQGDFDLASLGMGAPHLVRAMNVLRAYGLWEVRDAQRRMGRALADGGLLVEGSTDTEGHVACAHVWQRRGPALRYVGLLLGCDGARGFSPWLLRDSLPRDLRRHARAPEPVHALLSDWAACWQAVRSADPRASFARSVEALASTRDDVPFDPGLAAAGLALWQPPRPSQRPGVFDGRLAAPETDFTAGGGEPANERGGRRM